MSAYWSVPRLWPGCTLVCVGGGPSLTQEQVNRVRGHARVIAINDAYLLAPWADVLYFCDKRWFGWHLEGVKAFRGLKVTLDTTWGGPSDPRLAEHDIKVLRNTGKTGLEEKPTGLRTGKNGGYQSIQLARHLGARRIVLLGYDMKPAAVEVEIGGKRKRKYRTHWFGHHPKGGAPSGYGSNFLPYFPELAGLLAERNVEVLNATPGSALNVWPMVSLDMIFRRDIAA